MLEEAIAFAAQSHKGQIRKMCNTPYILHPMEVAAIVSTMTDSEDVMCAALLHDVVEDAGVSMQTLRERFGERVAVLVASETEDKRESRPAEETWKIRKEESLAALREAQDPDVRILWLSDKLSNMRSLYRGWLEQGDDVFQAFHQKDKREHEWYYRSVKECMADLHGTAAYVEFVSLLSEIFDR